MRHLFALTLAITLTIPEAEYIRNMVVSAKHPDLTFHQQAEVVKLLTERINEAKAEAVEEPAQAEPEEEK